ncbi:hypothetical protein ACWKWA_06045 [Dermacoccus abyssi]
MTTFALLRTSLLGTLIVSGASGRAPVGPEFSLAAEPLEEVPSDDGLADEDGLSDELLSLDVEDSLAVELEVFDSDAPPPAEVCSGPHAPSARVEASPRATSVARDAFLMINSFVCAVD